MHGAPMVHEPYCRAWLQIHPANTKVEWCTKGAMVHQRCSGAEWSTSAQISTLKKQIENHNSTNTQINRLKNKENIKINSEAWSSGAKRTLKLEQKRDRKYQ